MASCTFNDRQAGSCDAHSLDWSLLFMGGALTLLGMGHRGIGGCIARNLGTIALGTAAASLMQNRSWTSNPESFGSEFSRDVSSTPIRESHPASLKDSVDVASYESFPASDPPALR